MTSRLPQLWRLIYQTSSKGTSHPQWGLDGAECRRPRVHGLESVDGPAYRNGVTFCVIVQPNTSRNTVEAHETGTPRVRVTAPPRDEKANDAVVSLLAKTLDVAKGRVRIGRGHSSRQKVISVEPLTLEELRRRLNDVTGVNRR